ncbi:MAG: putative ATPase [Sulfurimonas sp.]|jgi:predicted ATPase|uniref:AAA family ATPase n=1 Tax=Sulfurimonas sp. TaxID=2022749 RepID=UPI0039E52B6E
MIEKIHIQNFKSIYDLQVEVARVNLFIGENGSGKSNLLEALVFTSASDSNKLDNEFLVSRGIRVTEPILMRSAFSDYNEDENIEIAIKYNNIEKEYSFYNRNTNYSKWEEDNTNSANLEISNGDLDSEILKKYMIHLNTKLIDFLIYSPENTALRIFEKEGQIQPLGINGEGLLKLLKVINNYEDKTHIETIIKSLQLFNWFENIEIPTDLKSNENKIVIKDKYLYQEFDQRSANEGFLFILFYITLIVAKETPKAFAIDNIDASLNPKLCTKLMTILSDLAEKYDKQIFLTTHNPAILDGIDLNDEEQKLFVVSRNKQGHTRMKNITAKDKPKSSTDETLKLSEAFLRGYLGGLPKGF